MSTRRTFLLSSAVGLAATRLPAAASDRVRVGVMGMGGRGKAVGSTFAGRPNTEVVYVCDPDETRLADGAAKLAAAAKDAPPPKPVKDFRQILDDKSVDVLICTSPNHWHAPATILATAAGKHVYVEKPCSHNPREGELMVAAARKHQKQVQMGNQRRSSPLMQEAVQALRDGVIGRVYLAQAYYANQRPTLGAGEAKDPPAGLDYELWQGPAARKPFHSNYLHYHWHWFWNWGNGELGNNGIHSLDVCRWGLGVDRPTKVTSTGGRYRFQDDQETPDTHLVGFEFPGGAMITWEGLSCNTRPYLKDGPMCVFMGEKGTLALRDNGYVATDPKGAVLKEGKGTVSDALHVDNFLAGVRTGEKLNSEIEEGAKSTLLCHLGNIAHRTGRTLHCDPKDGKVQNDPEAMKLWTREYAPGWEPKV